MSDDEDGTIPSWKRKLAAVRNEEPSAKSSSGVAGRSKQAEKQEDRPAAAARSNFIKQQDEDNERTSKSKGAKSTAIKQGSTKTRKQDYNPAATAVSAAGQSNKLGKVKTGKKDLVYNDRSSAGSDARPSKERASPSRSYRSPNRSPRRGGQSAGPTTPGPRVLKNQKKALEVFRSDDFDVQTFLCQTFQDLDAVGVEAAASSLLGLRDHCYQQVQQVVTDNHTVFLEACKGRQVLDECISKLRTHVQDVVSLVGELQQEPPFTQQVVSVADSMRRGGDKRNNAADTSSLLLQTQAGQGKSTAGMAAGNGSLATGTGKRPMTESIEAQLRAILQQLTLAASEKDYGTAVSLLGLLDDVMAIITRDTNVLANEVVDVAAWRQPWTMAIAEKREALMSDVESVLSTGVTSLSTIEIRGATACLAALAGDCHAIAALLACHTSRITVTEQQILKHHNAGASSEEDAVQTAGALIQVVCIGIAAAGEDIAALWGRAALRNGDGAESDGFQQISPAAPLLARWAEHQVRRTTRVVLQTALVPYADSAPLQHTLLCAQVGLVVCGTLELSHAVSVKAPFMAELWPHIEDAVTKALQQLAGQAQASALQEIQQLLNKKSGGTVELPPVIDLNSQFKNKADVVTLASSDVLVSQLTYIIKGLAPLAGPRLTTRLRSGLLAVLLAFIDGTASGFQQASPTHTDNRHVIAQTGQAIKQHLKELLSEDGPIAKAVAQLIPSCGALLDLSGLQAALSTAADTFDKMASSTAIETSAPAGFKTATSEHNSSSTGRTGSHKDSPLAVQKPAGAGVPKGTAQVGKTTDPANVEKGVGRHKDVGNSPKAEFRINDGAATPTSNASMPAMSPSIKSAETGLGECASRLSYGNGDSGKTAVTPPSSIQSALEARRTRLANRVQCSAADDSEDMNGSDESQQHQIDSVANKQVISDTNNWRSAISRSKNDSNDRRNDTGVNGAARPTSSGTSKSKQAWPDYKQQQATSGKQSDTMQQRASESGTARHARLAARLAKDSSSDSDHIPEGEKRVRITTPGVRVEHSSRMLQDDNGTSPAGLKAGREQREGRGKNASGDVDVAGKATGRKGIALIGNDKTSNKAPQPVDVKDSSQGTNARNSNALARLRARAAQSDSD